MRDRPAELGRELRQHDAVGDGADDCFRPRTERRPARVTRHRIVEDQVRIAGVARAEHRLAIGCAVVTWTMKGQGARGIGRGTRGDDRCLDAGSGAVAFGRQDGGEPFRDAGRRRVGDDDQKVDVAASGNPVAEDRRTVDVDTDQGIGGRIRELAREFVGEVVHGCGRQRPVRPPKSWRVMSMSMTHATRTFDARRLDMTDLTDFARLVALDHGLCIVSTLTGGGTIQSTLVNAGVLTHPASGQPVVGFVARGGSRKLAHLRPRPDATVAVRAGWDWVTAAGTAEVIGPDDPYADIDAERLRMLLREVFSAAGHARRLADLRHDDGERAPCHGAAHAHERVLQRLTRRG